MRRNVFRAGSFLAVVMVLLAAPALSAAGRTVTVGWFLERIAALRHLTASSGPQAERALREGGVALPKLDLGATLTEGDVVAIGSALGVSVSTKSPQTPFDEAHASAFLSSFSGQIGGQSSSTRDSGGVPNPASDNGKGKKKGHNKSSSEPLAPAPGF